MSPRLFADWCVDAAQARTKALKAAQASAQLQARTKALNAAHDRAASTLDLALLEDVARARLQAHITSSARLHSAALSQQFRALHRQSAAQLNAIGDRHAFTHRQASLRALVQSRTKQ